MDESEASSARSRKTVLIVDDDPGTLHVLANGIDNVLDMFDVVTATNGREAVEILEREPVDALVTDLSMPVMDGFALIAYITNRQHVVPVVVLSGMASSEVDERLARYGGLRVLRKPASYQDVAETVLEVITDTERGQVEGIPLAGILQLVESERRSCTVVVTSGRRKGRLYFQSGRLINAFSEDFGADGEAAAYDILGWGETAITFEHLPETVRRQIHTPMQLMLIEVAVVQDQVRQRTERSIPPPPQDDQPVSPGDEAEFPPPEEPEEPVAEAQPGNVDEVPSGEVASTEPVAAVDATADPPPVASDDAAEEQDAELPEAASQLDPPPPAEEPASERPLEQPLPVAARDASSDAAAASTTAANTAAANTAAANTAAANTAAANTAAPSETSPLNAVTSEPNEAMPDAHVTGLLEAVERLTQRARDADAALAAVAVEVEAFRRAQHRFDTVNARRERRQRELEAFRHEVAQMARELLGRVDAMFEPAATAEADRPEDGEPPQHAS